VQVTIVGELLVMSEASRGRMDSKTSKWDPNRPALMPKSILTVMKTMDSSALRPEDMARLGQSAASGGPGGGSGGMPGPRPSAPRSGAPEPE
jgi:hypothetical protein